MKSKEDEDENENENEDEDEGCGRGDAVATLQTEKAWVCHIIPLTDCHCVTILSRQKTNMTEFLRAKWERPPRQRSANPTRLRYARIATRSVAGAVCFGAAGQIGPVMNESSHVLPPHRGRLQRRMAGAPWERRHPAGTFLRPNKGKMKSDRVIDPPAPPPHRGGLQRLAWRASPQIQDQSRPRPQRFAQRCGRGDAGGGRLCHYRLRPFLRPIKGKMKNESIPAASQRRPTAFLRPKSTKNE